MTADNPTVDDLRLVARNMRDEGHISRAILIENAADRLEKLETALQDAKEVIEEFAVEQPIGVGPQWKQAFINAINWMRNNK